MFMMFFILPPLTYLVAFSTNYIFIHAIVAPHPIILILEKFQLKV